MVQPINYLAMFPQQDFLRDIQGGLQLGVGLREIQDKRAAQERAILAQQQYQQDISAAMASPTPQAFASLAVKYPQHREAFKQGWETLSADKQAGELRDMTTLAATLKSNRPDVAIKNIDERITRMKNAGQPTDQLQFLRDQVEQNPTQAYGSVLQVLAGVPGGDKVLTSLSAAEKAPAEIAKLQAEASKAGVDAKYAEQGALMDLEKKGWDIKKITADIDIAREANRIAAMNAATARETNTLKRKDLSLKVQEARMALDEKIRGKASEAESAATAIDNSLNTIERIKKNPSLPDVLGSIEGRMPSVFSDEGADAIALIETLGSQAFLAQIPAMKGQGALSNAEGEKLQSALTNLGRTQSEKQFRANLDEAARLMKKGRDNIAKRSGVPLGAPDVPAAPGARPPLTTFNR